MAPPVDRSNVSSSAELVRGYVDVEAGQCVDEVAWQEPQVCEEPPEEPVDLCRAGAQLQQMNGAPRGFAGANRFASNAAAAMQPQQPQVATPPPSDEPEVEKAVQPSGKGNAIDLTMDPVIHPFMLRNEYDLRVQGVAGDDVRRYALAALIIDDKVSEEEARSYVQDYEALSTRTLKAGPEQKEALRQEWKQMVARNKELYCVMDGSALNSLHDAANAAHPFGETISGLPVKPEQLEHLRRARDLYVRSREPGTALEVQRNAALNLGVAIVQLDIPGARAAELADHVIDTGVPNYQPSFEQFWKDCHPEKKGTEVASR